MRILYWQYFFTPPGGWGNRRSYDLVRFWKAAGVEAWVLAGGTYFPSALVKRLRGRRCFRTAEGIPIIFLPDAYHQYKGRIRRLWAFIRFVGWSIGILWRLRRRSFLLIATTPPPFLPGLAALRRFIAKKPYVVEIYDAWPAIPEALGAVPRFLRGAFHFLSYWSYRQAALCIALSPGIQERLNLSNSLVSYNGTRTDLFRRRVIPPFLPFRLIYAGTFGWVNNLSFLVQVAQYLRGYPAIEFWLVGDGAERPEIEKAAQVLPSLRVYPPVSVEKVPYYLSEAHIGVSTVLPVEVLATNSANKFYDYLAAGLVVGLNYRGWQAALLESTGCGFGAWNVKEFAERVLFYYWHRAAWERAASRSRELAEKMFDRRQLAQELLPHLNRLSL